MNKAVMINMLVSSGIVVVSWILGVIVKRIVINRVLKLAGKTRTVWDDVVFEEIKRWIVLWFILGGLAFALAFIGLRPSQAELGQKILHVLFIGSLFWGLVNIVDRLFSYYRQENKFFARSSLFANVVKLTIILLGVLIALNQLGISITPLLTTLGIGGLAVALALQDTLSNLFAGMYITLDNHIKVGDYIKLDSGEEGYVEDIGWRVTKIRQLPNNMVLVPNSKLAQAKVINYELPSSDLAVLVQVGVHYNSDLEKVEKITCEVAKEVMQTVPGGVPEFDPFIRYHTFGDFSINFTVILRGKTFVDRYLITHEFIKRLHKRYKEEGIVIPYPITAINYTQENPVEVQ